MKTIKNDDGKVIFFSYEDFINDIVEGNCCFICGQDPNSKEFNNEHIIPNWILSRFNLHDQYIILPNNTRFKYSQYTIPCCKECNSELGEKIETPISKLLSQSFEEIIEEINSNPENLNLLSIWLSLIFFKTHLKDNALLMNKDKRFNEGKIGDNHYWESMHHIHCVIRSHYTKAKIHPNAMGTAIIFRIHNFNNSELYDYIDTPYGRVIMIQIRDFCMLHVVDDAGASAFIYQNQLKKISGMVNPYQVRELIANLNYINLNLKERPVFKSFIEDKGNGDYIIFSELPKSFEVNVGEGTIGEISSLFHFYMQKLVEESEENNTILNQIKKGEYSFLFNNEDEFLSNESHL